MRHSFGKRNFSLQLIVFCSLTGAAGTLFAAPKFVSGLVPDWNQPYRYINPNGPGPDPNRPNPPNIFAPHDQWNDWCAPSSAANLAGHWADVRGKPVADTTAFPGTTVAWGAGPSWQDYLADRNRPAPQAASGSLPSPTTDIGWYMDTNLGIPWDNNLGVMGGYFFAGDAPHPGTLLKYIHVGLQLFLNNRYSLSSNICWRTGTRGVGYAAGIDPSGLPAVVHPNEMSAFAEVKAEIDANRTLIISFQHWSITPVGTGAPQGGTLTNEAAYGYTNYFFATPSSGMPNAEDEYWNLYNNDEALGHAVTCVGYIVAGDQADPWAGPPNNTPTDWVIVHDNWASTPRNVAVPIGTPAPAPGGTLNQYWVANTTAVPWPTGVKFVKGLVPDWNQPYRYNQLSPNGGPGALNPPPPPFGAVQPWSDWCVPTSAANLAGHWEDHHGAPVADGTPFAGSTVAWGAGPSWQDYLADGFARPAAMNGPGLPPSPTDIGWYMDTNRGMGGGGGYFFGDGAHGGTYVKNIHIGLANYLNSLYSCVNTNNASGWWNTGTEGKNFAAGVDPSGGAAHVLGDPVSAFNEVTSEIDRDHTLIISFLHWNLLAAGAPDMATDSTNSEAQFGGSYYAFNTTPGSSNDEDEVWNTYNGDYGLGHAVTAVGYIPAGDPLDPFGGTNWVIVHDNWATTPRNVIVPFDYANNWVANTTAVPDPSFLRVTGIEMLDPTNCVIRFTGLPSGLHDLQWRDEMTNNSWSTSLSNIVFSAGTMEVTNPVSTAEQKRFYRVKASY